MNADALNLGLLVLTIATSVWCTTLPDPPDVGALGPTATPATRGEDRDVLIDARGNAVPVRAYSRIVSLNTISDHLLLELVEPQRVAAVTGYTLANHPDAWRFGDRPGVERSDQIEFVIAQKPDLVIVSQFANESYMARLREIGIHVFDLGDMLGVETTLENVRTLGQLLGVPERAERVERDLVRQLWALENAVPEDERIGAMYLNVHGDHLSGGTRGTSYADVLHYGGVRDVAAAAGHSGWPQFDPEQVLAIDPPVIVTSEGMASAIRGHSLLAGLTACGPDGRIVELPGAFLGDPGFGVVEAARRLQEALHPDRAPTRLGARGTTAAED